MNTDLTGRTALVTGSTSGIGRAIAATFARAGADVVVNGRSADRVTSTAEELAAETGGQVRGIAADISTAEGAGTSTSAAPAFRHSSAARTAQISPFLIKSLLADKLCPPPPGQNTESLHFLQVSLCPFSRICDIMAKMP